MPELYVSQTPVFNAGAYGVDDPFIVLHSAALELLDDDELRVLLAHEMGHVVSGHALYRTIAEILLSVEPGRAAVPGRHRAPADPARDSRVVPQVGALLRPRRACSAARTSLAAQRLFMKMAGGGRGRVRRGQMNLDAFMHAGQRVPRRAATGSTWSTRSSTRWRSPIR